MMTAFGYNTNYLTKDNMPWFPIMGEIHYSRYPRQYWKESLYKMKAGGVEVVSAYAIWIHHEEIEGVFDFSGNKELRSFIKICQECGLYLLLRIGPWVHGEVRNGGFPDWLLKKGYLLRSNDPRYLAEVQKYYDELYNQARGLLLKDGGPIIGIQLENELGHCGGAHGEEGEEHIRTLHRMAAAAGFEVPYYTATGWGGAVTGGLLPVMGGYPEAPWDQRLTEIEPSVNYVFTYERNDHGIGSDHGIGADVTFDYSKFPFLTAELGGGLQVTHHRRPVAEAEDIGAMTLAKLGSGCNLLGYYMYHGGTNPMGKLSTLQESRATGYPNDYTELSYDFRAPIREYGQVSDTLKEIKLYAMFAKDFGSELCTMPAYIPEDNPVIPKNLKDLRYSFRHNGVSGYAFVNNYQRRYPMAEHKNVVLSCSLPEETVKFPEITVKDKDYFFLPFNMIIGYAVLKTALVTPLCILNNPEKAYIFYGDREPEFDVRGDLGSNKLISISRTDARNAWKITLDKEYLIISEAAVLQTEQGIELSGRGSFRLKVYPAFDTVPEGFNLCGTDGDFTLYEKKVKELNVTVEARIASDIESVPGSNKVAELKSNKEAELESNKKAEFELNKEAEPKSDKEPAPDSDKEAEPKIYKISLQLPKEPFNDCFLQFTYQGDRAKLYLNGEFIADHFYTGRDWEVGLKRFNLPDQLTLEVYPLPEKAEVYLEQWPVMKNGVACELSRVTAETEYKTEFKL